MSNEMLFTERQRFKQPWLWIILLVLNAVFFYGTYLQLFKGQAFGDKPMSDASLMLTLSFTLLLSVLFFSIRLDTVIKKEGIKVRLFPFHLSFKHYPWHTLSKCYIRQYDPIAEYGGWGLRMGLFGKGKAWNIRGNMGLQLEFIDGEKLLIGTQKPEELHAIIQKII